MDYELSEASVADVPGIVAVASAAFANDAIIPHIDSNVEPELRTQITKKWYRRRFETAHLTGTRFFKVVDTKTGQIAGFGKWDFPVTLTAEQKVEKAQLEEDEGKEPAAPGTKIALRDDCFGQLKVRRNKWVDPEKDYFMHILCVSPDHHRKGLGSMLLSHGLALADRDGARAYIEASHPGYQLYLRHGWKDVDEITLDKSKYGLGEGIYVQKTLMRQPQKM